MKPGDIVRFKRSGLANRLDNPKSKLFKEWQLGLLVEYHSWEKIATILYKGEIVRVHCDRVQKAGKKDVKKMLNT